MGSAYCHRNCCSRSYYIAPQEYFGSRRLQIRPLLLLASVFGVRLRRIRPPLYLRDRRPATGSQPDHARNPRTSRLLALQRSERQVGVSRSREHCRRISRTTSYTTDHLGPPCLKACRGPVSRRAFYEGCRFILCVSITYRRGSSQPGFSPLFPGSVASSALCQGFHVRSAWRRFQRL